MTTQTFARLFIATAALALLALLFFSGRTASAGPPRKADTAAPRAPRRGPALTPHRRVFPQTFTSSVLIMVAARRGWDGPKQLIMSMPKTISSMRYM